MCLFLLVAPGTQKTKSVGLWGQNLGVSFWLQSEYKCYLLTNCDTRLKPFSPPSLLLLTNDHCSIDINMFKWNKADRTDSRCLLATTSPFAKPDILCDCVSLPNYPLFFLSSSLSTFASKRILKKKRRGGARLCLTCSFNFSFPRPATSTKGVNLAEMQRGGTKTASRQKKM